LIFGAGGLMIAFVPFQDRPLETWLIAFLRSIYSPTIYTYRKMPDRDWINLLSVKAGGDKKMSADEEAEADTPVKDRNRVQEFIDSLPSVQIGNKLEKEENEAKEKAELLDTNTKLKEQVVTPVVEKNEQEKIKETDWRDKKTDLNLQTEKLSATAKVTYGEIPMPGKPEVPNILIGMVTDAEGKIVEDVIVEIQDEKGNPARVLKTNSLGQFKTTAPLASGKYLVITDKEGYSFDRVNIELVGKIVEPIKIKAKI